MRTAYCLSSSSFSFFVFFCFFCACSSTSSLASKGSTFLVSLNMVFMWKEKETTVAVVTASILIAISDVWREKENDSSHRDGDFPESRFRCVRAVYVASCANRFS